MDDLLAPFRKEDRYESMKLVDKQVAPSLRAVSGRLSPERSACSTGVNPRGGDPSQPSHTGLIIAPPEQALVVAFVTYREPAKM